MARPQFIGTCVQLQTKDLHDYDDSSRDITYTTFRKHVGAVWTADINTWAGWPGTHFSRDWCVRYSKGKWKGKPAVCMMHSAIHHIWVL